MKIERTIERLVELGGSDLYIKVGVRPVVRAHGELRPTDLPQVSPAEAEAMAREVLPPPKARALMETGDAETAVTLGALGRFRINAYLQRGVVGLAIRRIVGVIPDFDSLQLPPVMRSLAEETRGLILITGPSGMGKTTTIAAVIGHINRTRRWHVVTLEDPVEVVHRDRLCLIDQREIGTDTPSYQEGLKYAVRQDPDVLFIGEIRDEATAEAAVRAAETGHLVISTMHTIDATETVNRLLELFPANRQEQARRSLAGSLRAVVSQRLVRRADGRGRVPAVEVMVANGRVSDLILEPGRTNELVDVIRAGESYGMQTFDQALLELVRSGRVAPDEALVAASNRHDFRLFLTGSSLADFSPAPA